MSTRKSQHQSDRTSRTDEADVAPMMLQILAGLQSKGPTLRPLPNHEELRDMAFIEHQKRALAEARRDRLTNQGS